MSTQALTWDDLGEKKFRTGVSKGVLFVQDGENYGAGVAWSGLTKVTEKPTGGEISELYADDSLYANLMSTEKFEASIEAYFYPDEFAVCLGEAELTPGVSITQQTRKRFALSYVNRIGNDTKGTDYGYELHIVFGCIATPSEKSHSTINDNVEAETMSFEVKTTPVKVDNMKPTAHIVIDSTKFTTSAAKTKLEAFEKILYGSTDAASRLPEVSEIKTLLTVAAG